MGSGKIDKITAIIQKLTARFTCKTRDINQPQYVIAIMLDEPKSQTSATGGVVAAPIYGKEGLLWSVITRCFALYCTFYVPVFRGEICRNVMGIGIFFIICKIKHCIVARKRHISFFCGACGRTNSMYYVGLCTAYKPLDCRITKATMKIYFFLWAWHNTIWANRQLDCRYTRRKKRYRRSKKNGQTACFWVRFLFWSQAFVVPSHHYKAKKEIWGVLVKVYDFKNIYYQCYSICAIEKSGAADQIKHLESVIDFVAQCGAHDVVRSSIKY